MMTMNQVKIGIVGAGTWGENHARIYQAHPFAKAAAICDQNLDKAKAVAARTGIEAVYSNIDDLLKKSDCDAVAIVTPDFAHADLAITAAAAGKHLLIEKPLATTAEDVYRMMDAFEKYKVRVMVDLHNRWNPPFQAAWQSIQAGEMGDLYSGYFRLNDIKWVATDLLPWADQSSILWFLGSHSLDTLRWLFDDEVKRVYAVSRKGLLRKEGINVEDIYQTTLEFRKGGIAQMENGWITPDTNPCVNDIKCTLLGTKGQINIDASSHNLIQKVTQEKLEVPDILVQNHIFGQPKGFAFESIRSFIDCLITDEPFKLTLQDAANTSLAILAIMESAKKREPVDVNLNC